MKNWLCILLVSLSTFLVSFASYAFEFNDFVILKRNPNMSDGELNKLVEARDEIYYQMHKHYIEMCTATQYIPSEDVGFAKKGGTGGHATLFISSACIDETKPYPALRMCEKGEEALDAKSSGVGISLNLMFSNIRFVAVPGRENFYRGPVDWSQSLVPSMIDDIKKYYYEKPWFNSVRLAEKYTKSCVCEQKRCTDSEMKKCYIDKNIGIDFASGLARTSYCVRLPVPEKGIGKMIAYLNKRNEEPYKASKGGTKQGYFYDVALDNCSHIIHNAIAQTGFFDVKKQLKSSWINRGRGVLSEIVADLPFETAKKIVGGEFGYLSVPTHNLYHIVERSIDLNYRKLKELLSEQDLSDTLKNDDYSWLPGGSGSLVTVISQKRDNEAFALGKSGFKAFLVALGGFRKFTDPNHKNFKTYYSNLCDNLRHHRRNMINTLLRMNSMNDREEQKLRSYDKFDILDLLKEKMIESKIKIQEDLDLLNEHSKVYCI